MDKYLIEQAQQMNFRHGVTTTNCFWLLRLLELGVDPELLLAVNDEANSIEHGKGYDQLRKAG